MPVPLADVVENHAEDEQLGARHFVHHREHAFVTDAALDELFVDHAPACDREVVRGVAFGFSRRAMSVHARHGFRSQCSMSVMARWSVRSSASGVTEIQPCSTAWKSVPSRDPHTGS